MRGIKMKLKYLELHKPLFFGSKNFTEKLDKGNSKCQDVTMQYDDKQRMVLVTYRGQTCYIPIESVHSMVEQDDSPVVEPVAVRGFMGKVKAQVSTPQGIKERE
jgi:hypothetical protein